MTDYKLTLVAQFDDIVRNCSVLTEGIESDFLGFVTNQDDCRKRWLQAECDLQNVNLRVKKVEAENSTLSTKLKHARGQIEHEMKKRQRVEQEKESLERQIMLVRELLMDRNHGTMLNDKDREKLTFLTTDFQPSHLESPARRGTLTTIDESASLLSLSDISYDKTEEDLDNDSHLRSGRKWKRPSAPLMDEDDDTPPGKKRRERSKSRDGRRRTSRKHRRSKSASVIALTTVTVDDGKINAQSEIKDGAPRRRSHRRHNTHSEADLHNTKEAVDSDDSTMYGNNRNHRSPLKDGTNVTPTSTVSPGLRHYSSAGKGLNRPHAFVSKTVIKPETCNPCGKRIRFSRVAMKCKDCRVTAHPECKDLVPLPCIPSIITPGTAKGSAGLIADFAPGDPPMIPAIVIHCVNEVESRGLREEGIYRVPGTESEVKGLKEKFLRGRGTPNLTNINDINTVCGCLKDFLRGLKEPLVTYSLWHDFTNAADNPDRDDGNRQMYQAVSQLPQANRDTLAFLILHLQRVGECPENKMPASNLAKVFGPTIIGYSNPEPPPLQMLNETRKQATVLEKLMSISCDYWLTFLNIDAQTTYTQETIYTPATPESRVPHSMLGPLTTPDGGTGEKKGWFTPRFGSKSRHVSKKPTHFFTSPSLE